MSRDAYPEVGVSKWTVRPDWTGKPDRTGPNVFRSGPRSEVLDQFGLRSGRSGPSTTPSYSSGPSTTPSYSPRPSTPPSDSPRPSRSAVCSNCKLLIGKIKVVEATLQMYMHPENHILDSTAQFH
uniref:Uncharacterized protein n=1 Tax=Tanacetum cinerariifolium TaxID=118510 RepID=A0A699JZ76_TANCI|nr:hypothetical protein [Tanacetum cinerariifolium]